MTAFFGILRSETHRLEYCSAGQGPILFYSRGNGPTTLPARPLNHGPFGPIFKSK